MADRIKRLHQERAMLRNQIVEAAAAGDMYAVDRRCRWLMETEQEIKAELAVLRHALAA